MTGYMTGGPWQNAAVALGICLTLLAIYRRSRPRKVRPGQAMLLAALVIFASAFSILSTGYLTNHLSAIYLWPLALALGLALGWILVRTMHFWRDASTGQLWVQGGAIYLVVWFTTLALRFGIRYAATGSLFGTGVSSTSTANVAPPGAVLSGDMVIVAMGLWIARTAAVLHRYHSYDLPSKKARVSALPWSPRGRPLMSPPSRQSREE